ncbi:hypothetical protein [Streptomyces sp. MNP-20]|uniref:hypothetical protein n=1 Tax=Streptomyces sp. MNP-20 TaxID=2721165 RepID=UPI002814EF17|nr:hypothetical protein [Streptomyces sp. MNP-20]
MTSVLYPDLPQNGLIGLMGLIGVSGAGKSTLARAWPASQVLSLDGLCSVVSDDSSVKSSVLSRRPSVVGALRPPCAPYAPELDEDHSEQH